MTRPDPLDEAMLDRLLDAHKAPPLPADFAQRVTDEVARQDRPATLPPFAPRPHAPHRPWTRRGLIAGVVAINLIVASAIAATFSGHFPALQHIAITAARVLHIRHHHAAPPHISRVAHVAPSHQEAIPVVVPVPPADPTPAELFAERHPLMAMRREGLIAAGRVDGRRAILFAEHHPFAARALVRRARIARLRELHEADFGSGAGIGGGRAKPDYQDALPAAATEISPARRQPEIRPRLQDRDAFEQERRALEQRADALWPEKRADLRNVSDEAHHKPVTAGEEKRLHRAGPRQKWHDRIKARRSERRRRI